jgi:hypothetical protein
MNTKARLITSAESSTSFVEKPNGYRAILWGGLSAGVLDITAAFVNSGLRGRSPMWVLQSIAGGLLGVDSFKGGLPAAVLGAIIHFFIAFVACTVYYLASRRIEFLVQRAVVAGVLYGVMVYLFMYGVVLPMTFHRSFFSPLSAVLTGLMIHIVCVGLPIALAVRRYSTEH